MPSSGARSGTPPSRSERGAGNGGPSGVPLVCGHSADEQALVTIYPNRSKLYRCPEGCGLVKKGKAFKR